MKRMLPAVAILQMLLLTVARLPAQEAVAQKLDTAPVADNAGASAVAPQLSTLHREATTLPECLDRFAEDFVPMSNKQRFMEALKSELGPDNFLGSALYAAIAEGLDRPREWDTHIDGYGARVGSSYAEHFIDEAIANPLAFALHEDNRYFRSGKQGVGARLAYVFESTVLARHDNGSRGLSVSGMAGAVSAAFLSRAWQPPSTSSPADAAVSFGFILATHALGNGLREFGPRPIRKFLE
jgi:hypothetical protein